MRRSMLLLAILWVPFTGNTGGMELHGKPRSLLQISIAPTQSGLVPSDIKPGDVIEFRVAARPLGAEGDMTIKVDLIGGVRLVSGDTAWTGPAKRGEEKFLLVAVKVPKHGGGIIRARASMSPSASASFSAVAEYAFGNLARKKPSQLPEVRKDNKGRSIREYR